MRGLLVAFFCCVSCVLCAAPVLQYDQDVCTVQPSEQKIGITTQEQQEIDKIITKTPLQYLQIGDECRKACSMYVSLKVTGGAFSGNDLEILLIKGKVFQRMRICDSCPFSPWRHVTNYRFNGKKDKKREFFVCSDGTLKFTNPEKD